MYIYNTINCYITQLGYPTTHNNTPVVPCGGNILAVPPNDPNDIFFSENMYICNIYS